MAVRILLQPSDEPLTLAEAKLACRVDADYTGDDDTIANYITTARWYCEETSGHAYISRTILMTLDRFPRTSQQCGLQFGGDWFRDQRIPLSEADANYWPDRAVIRLPAPLQSLIAVQYLDTANALQTLDSSLYRVDYISDPARIAPAYGQIWPLTVQQTQAVNIRAIVGYGPSTTIASAIVATGSQTVTPASMYGIYAQNITTDPLYPGTQLAIDTGTKREVVTVTAVTASTFTATFNKTHAAGVTVQGAVPEYIRTRMKMLIAHWYQNREAVSPGSYGTLPLAAEAFHWAGWNGELR